MFSVTCELVITVQSSALVLWYEDCLRNFQFEVLGENVKVKATK